MLLFEKEFFKAQEVARVAGKKLKQATKKVVELSSGHDIKLALDKEIESFICGELEYFGHGFLGEEYGASDHLDTSKPYWIIDPIDGTLNYLQEIPISCVSIALWKGSNPILGIIYDFNNDDLISSLVDFGSFYNDVKLCKPKPKKVEDSVLASGFPSYLLHDDKTLLQVVQRIKVFKKVRFFGSAAISVSYVALGRVNAYYEDSIALWDVAAGVAICKILGIEVQMTCLDSSRHLYKVEVNNLIFDKNHKEW